MQGTDRATIDLRGTAASLEFSAPDQAEVERVRAFLAFRKAAGNELPRDVSAVVMEPIELATA